MDNYYDFNICIIGDHGVGKSQIQNKYVKGTFDSYYKSDINLRSMFFNSIYY